MQPFHRGLAYLLLGDRAFGPDAADLDFRMTTGTVTTMTRTTTIPARSRPRTSGRPIQSARMHPVMRRGAGGWLHIPPQPVVGGDLVRCEEILYLEMGAKVDRPEPALERRDLVGASAKLPVVRPPALKAASRARSRSTSSAPSGFAAADMRAKLSAVAATCPGVCASLSFSSSTCAEPG